MNRILVIFIIIAAVTAIQGGSAVYIRDWDQCRWTNAQGDVRLNSVVFNNTTVHYPQIDIPFEAKITQIGTFHWLGGFGTPSTGNISLRLVQPNSGSNIWLANNDYGPWKTQGQSVMGVPNAWWWAFPDKLVTPGLYEIVCEEPGELSWTVTEGSYPAGAAAVDFKRTYDEESYVYVIRVEGPDELEACGRKENLSVYWGGHPDLPLRLELRVIPDEKGVSLGKHPPDLVVDEPGMPVIWESALSCCGYSNQDKLTKFELVLYDDNGIESDPYPFSVICKSAFHY
jgi:hypothetical protein